MDVSFRLISLAVVCAVVAVLVRERNGVMGVLLTLAACSAIMLAAVKFMSPAIEFARQLQELSKLDATVTAPLMKVTGLGIVTQIAVGLCEDSGENALAKTVQICGSIFSVYVSIPLMNAVMEMLIKLIGG